MICHDFRYIRLVYQTQKTLFVLPAQAFAFRYMLFPCINPVDCRVYDSLSSMSDLRLNGLTGVKERYETL